ncbi:hypothetical protein PPACK8108_LOCUS5331 [Phakopsora pachyrhizi]|uniref:Uncharacterized protein n=1 Tax=Phakopsora pachyrhizi TaxID=170000 RepID=A0AAV0AQN6_PHAPC|nr:hypothetical protein PPACK8108_LOCUS5331 [Phakopsora pachyrhizi]
MEILNCTLGNIARPTLKYLGLPIPFWALAYIMACYIHNQITNNLTKSSTPYQLIHGHPSQIDHLKPFGDVGFVHDMLPSW